MDHHSVPTGRALATAFVAATETDDLDLVQAHFEQPDVQAELVVWNTVQCARRLGNRPHFIDPSLQWYQRTRDSEYQFIRSILNRGRVEILPWFFAREQLALLGDMLHEMARVLLRVYRTSSATFELAEIVLESLLFTDVMDHDERRRVLGAALQVAVSMGLTRWVNLLLAHGADPTFAPDYPSLLTVIVHYGNSETFNLLVDSGTWIVGERLSIPRRHDDSKNLVCDMVRRGADAHTVSLTHGSVLHHAASNCYREIVQSLIDDGFADVDVRDAAGRTPLMVVGSGEVHQLDGASPQHVIVQLLLDANADIHAVDTKQRGVLHHVVRHGDAACAELLLARGADPNAVDNAGRTPMFTALSYLLPIEKAVKILTLLVQAGADPFRGDNTTPSTKALLDGTALGRSFVRANPRVFDRVCHPTATERRCVCTLL